VLEALGVLACVLRGDPDYFHRPLHGSRAGRVSSDDEGLEMNDETGNKAIEAALEAHKQTINRASRLVSSMLEHATVEHNRSV
jgi:hypothetical protein